MELWGAQRQVACGRAKDSCQSPWREGARKRSTEERTEIEWAGGWGGKGQSRKEGETVKESCSKKNGEREEQKEEVRPQRIWRQKEGGREADRLGRVGGDETTGRLDKDER